MKKYISILIVCLIADFAIGQNLFREELNLPVKGLSQRVTKRANMKGNETLVLFDEEGPGCLFHWWFTYDPRPDRKRDPQEGIDLPHYLQIRVFYDGNEEPAIDMTLAHFFSVLQKKDVYPINNAAIKILPRNALNSYFPMPFKKCRIELENTCDVSASIWFMGDWQEYPDYNITPYRFKAIYKGEFPAAPAGSMLMADISGEGFLAGMTKSVIRIDKSDSWYHSGGDLVLIDGETNPRAMRGIGGEDVFNMSFGVWEVQNDWVGTLVKNNDPYERVMYRIFGPCPIWFNESLVLRFGTKANNIETVVYTYVAEKERQAVNTPKSWKLAGPFECNNYEDFEKEEWADQTMKKWPEKHTADFGNYISTLNGFPKGPYTFDVPLSTQTEHCWCDISASYRGRQKTNTGAQPGNVSAYAVSTLTVDEPGTYNLILGYDDWIKVWINGKPVYSGKHEKGLESDSVQIELAKKENEIKVKLANFDNEDWRLWSFTARLEK